MSTTIRGNFDGVKENNLVGWVFDPANHPSEVMAMIDGEFIAFAEANNYRPDLERAGVNNGLCGFRIAIPEQFLEGGTHKVELWLEGGQRRLGPAFTFQSPSPAPSSPTAAKVEAPEPKAGPADSPAKPGNDTVTAKAATQAKPAPEAKPATDVEPAAKTPPATETKPAKVAKTAINMPAQPAKAPTKESKAPAATKEAKPFVPGKGKAALIPKIDAKSAAFNTIQRSVSESSIFNGTIGALNKFCNLYAENPYYERLRLAARGTTRLDCFVQISNTLSRVDQAREGQLPKVGPLVSIIMPAHNREDLIDDAIRSVLAQSYKRFELIICDDSSQDNTVAAIKSFKDPRIILTKHAEQKGAAAARNSSLKLARGDIIAYLDSDNVWHPRYLEIMLEELANWPGNMAAYAGYYDIDIGEDTIRIKKAEIRGFHLEDQLAVPFVDLNSFVHRRQLYDVLGGFDERLARRQDYDMIARYCWLREPRVVPHVLNLYQRIANAQQITKLQKEDTKSPQIIADKIQGYYKDGLPAQLPSWVKKVSVVSWDMSRNHFAKAYCVAEALSKHVEVEMISYRFFDEEIFQPLADKKPPFECKYFEGGTFPDFFGNFAKGMEAITGDVIYAVKPRLTSFGLGLMANYHTGKPIMLECNDLETVVNNAKSTDAHAEKQLTDLFAAADKAKIPYELIWSEILDPLVAEIPTVFTHNINLNLHYDRRCLYMRNIKDDSLYRPQDMDRDAIRKELGFKADDRIILFGGLVRKHKGIFELVDLLNALGDPRYKLLVVGSRDTPDLMKLSKEHRDNITVLPPQPPERMAAINLASDLIVLWLDPNVPAGQYQSPYKMSDALAMGPTIIASPTSDLADLGTRGLMLNVPFGNQKKLVATIRRVFDQPEETAARQQRARKFFEREFSYPAVFPAFALGVSRLEKNKVYPVSERFAEFFAEYRRRTLAGK
ncbi:glycosyltransferase [Sphingobium sp. Leaf26]|uniref:glycosyltransferase n=1 Tax=Sphingobium sp. Leaf26 TaxID=1735693 RepID=UPI0009EBBFD1|nr:glycosyltransferase [Sphingobium sp. Leaf26]